MGVGSRSLRLHSDFAALIFFYESLQGHSQKDTLFIVEILKRVGEVLENCSFLQAEAIILGGSFGRHDKMPRVDGEQRILDSDLDFLILERPRGLAKLGLGIPEIIFSFEDGAVFRYVAKRLNLPFEILYKPTFYRIAAHPRIVLQHVSALSMLQGGVLVLGEIRNVRLREEYGRFREGGLPIEYRRPLPLSAQL